MPSWDQSYGNLMVLPQFGSLKKLLKLCGEATDGQARWREGWGRTRGCMQGTQGLNPETMARPGAGRCTEGPNLESRFEISVLNHT